MFLKITYTVLVVLFLSSCATYDPKTGTYTDDSVSANSSVNDPVMGTIGIIIGIVELSKASSPISGKEGISGLCKIEVHSMIKSLKPCIDTSVSIKNLKTKHQQNVWVNSEGYFKFKAKKGQEFQIQAMYPTYHLESKIIKVKSPAFVNIQIQ